MHLFRLESDPAADQGVVGIAICTLVRTCKEYIPEVAASGDGQVELVPVFGAGVSPGDFVLRFRLEEGVRYA